MLTSYEHYALTEMLGDPGSPPRYNGAFVFRSPWERQAFGMALAFRKLGFSSGTVPRRTHCRHPGLGSSPHQLDDPSWDYYECWLAALETTLLESSLATASELSTALTAFDDAPPQVARHHLQARNLRSYLPGDPREPRRRVLV